MSVLRYRPCSRANAPNFLKSNTEFDILSELSLNGTFLTVFMRSGQRFNF